MNPFIQITLPSEPERIPASLVRKLQRSFQNKGTGQKKARCGFTIKAYQPSVPSAPEDEDGGGRVGAKLYLTRFSISLLRKSMSLGSGSPGHHSPSHCLVLSSGSLRKLNAET